MAINIFQDYIEAEKPKAIEGERIYVYVPTATYDRKGIVSYDEEHFNIDSDDKLHIRLHNPTEKYSLVKLSNRDFVYNSQGITEVKWPMLRGTSSDIKISGFGLVKPNTNHFTYKSFNGDLLINLSGIVNRETGLYVTDDKINLRLSRNGNLGGVRIGNKIDNPMYVDQYDELNIRYATATGQPGTVKIINDARTNALFIGQNGTLSVRKATNTYPGSVKPGNGLVLLDDDGTIAVNDNIYMSRTEVEERLEELDEKIEEGGLEDLEAIKLVIPTQASADNQLADKDFVNSTINAVAAYYITSNSSGDAFSTKAALTSATVFYSGGEVRTPTRNDYALVLSDESHNNSATRYTYQNGQWEYQYTLNTSSFTAAQLAALNSGVTSDLLDSFAKSTDVYDKDTVDQNITDAIEGAYGIIEEVSFVGSLSEDTITYEFDNMPEGFELENNKLYIGDFNLALTTFTGTIENDTKLVIQNGTDSIRILCKKNDSINVDSTVGDLCQLQSYDLVTGFKYRVIFQCRIIGGETYIYVYGIVDESASAMHGEELHSKIVNGTLRPDTVITCMSSYEHDGYEYMKGNSYLIHGEYDDGELILSAEVCGVGEIYVDTKIGDIDTILTTLNSGGGV